MVEMCVCIRFLFGVFIINNQSYAHKGPRPPACFPKSHAAILKSSGAVVIYTRIISSTQYRIHLPESKKEKTCGGRGSNTGRLLRKFPKWKGVILTTRLPSLDPRRIGGAMILIIIDHKERRKTERYKMVGDCV